MLYCSYGLVQHETIFTKNKRRNTLYHGTIQQQACLQIIMGPTQHVRHFYTGHVRCSMEWYGIVILDLILKNMPDTHEVVWSHPGCFSVWWGHHLFESVN